MRPIVKIFLSIIILFSSLSTAKDALSWPYTEMEVWGQPEYGQVNQANQIYAVGVHYDEYGVGYFINNGVNFSVYQGYGYVDPLFGPTPLYGPGAWTYYFPTQTPEKAFIQAVMADGSGLTGYGHVYITKVDLTATDLFGAVPEANEQNPGAYVHYNIDNDNQNTDASGNPIADKDEDGPVTGEDDLKLLTIEVGPFSELVYGQIILKREDTTIRIWKNPQKGADNKILVDTNEKIWDLSDPNQKADLDNIKNSLYVEGYQNTTTPLLWGYFYDPPRNVTAGYDIIKYTFIAATCGDQPKPEQRIRFEQAFPNLIHCEWSITDQGYPNNTYNCIAWSVGESNIWYNDLDDNPEYGIEGIDESYGDNDNVYRVYAETFTDSNGNGIFDFTDTNGNGVHDPGEPGESFVDGSGDGAVNGKYDVSDIDEFYRKKKGWKPIASGAGDAEAMYYSEYHAAKKMVGCTDGAGKWIMYESKTGQWERIEHVYDQLNGSAYGAPIKYYK